MSFIKKLPYSVRIALGVIFLLIGIIGILIPFLQGWFFFLLALYCINPDKAHEIRTKFGEKWKKFRDSFRKRS